MRDNEGKYYVYYNDNANDIIQMEAYDLKIWKRKW